MDRANFIGTCARDAGRPFLNRRLLTTINTLEPGFRAFPPIAGINYVVKGSLCLPAMTARSATFSRKFIPRREKLSDPPFRTIGTVKWAVKERIGGNGRKTR